MPPMPLGEFRAEARRHLSEVLVSVKAKNKVVTRNVNVTRTAGASRRTEQLTPRGQLHNETVYGLMRQPVTREEKVGGSFDEKKIQTVCSLRIREALLKRLYEFGGDPKKAFTGKNSLEKNPLFIDDSHTVSVPQKVKTMTFESVFTIRKPVAPDLKLDKVIDKHVKQILQQRLDEFGGDPKKAFVNLDQNPIWLNRERGIAIKRVTIRGVSNAESLHDKHDVQGHRMLGRNGASVPTDFVSTSNNHHVAIFRDAEGNLQDHVVSFFEATERANQHLPIVDREYKSELGWQFLFTMKRNEYFVFPNEKTGFNPNEVDLMDSNNYKEISENLFRVQSISRVQYGKSIVRDYIFRHHLETVITYDASLKNIVYKQFKTLKFAENIVKVRVNHIGQIVAVGEY